MNYPKNRYTGPKPWMDHDWLYNEYVIKDRRTKEIAEEYGCRQNTIQCWLVKHGISKPITKHVRDTKRVYETYDYLYHEHIELGKSVAEIAEENGVSYDAIVFNLRKNEIPVQKRNRHKIYSDEEIDQMAEMYTSQKMSALQIAEYFETDHNTIIRNLQKRGIETRNMIEAQFNANGKEIPEGFDDAELLRRMHWDDGMSCLEIGIMFGVEPGTVRRNMHRLGISTKTNAESKIGLMTGDRHPNWKDGVTPLNHLLREYFHTNLVPVIAKRDNYTCQLCGKTHVALHVHHIREFSEIVSEICSEHPGLNPDDPDDRMKLYDIITHDDRFLDEDNLITFCRDCHFFEIHDYDRKTISSQASFEEGSETIPEWEYTVSV